jgi:ATP-dependent DNA helicase RecG
MKFKETETIELKKSTSELKEAIISISAILNKHGKGTVYFGIDDDGIVVGQQIGKSTLKDISKSISDHIDPKIFPDIKVEKIEDKDCIIVEFAGHKALYSAFGRFYLRTGEEDKKLSTDEIEHLVEKKKNYVYSWGAEVSESLVSTADVSILRSFIKRGKGVGRISFSFDSVKNVLNKLNLVKGDKLLNAGRALFCKNNSVEVQAAVFAGKDKITFLDIQRFRGTLFELAEKSESYVKEHINWRADLSGSRRIEIPEIPVRAITEAIINSLCHRDFANPKSNEVAIYRDRIEIYNPGQFPFEYSPQDFIKGNKPSIPRNPLIAETLYLSEDIEKWGSGLRRISKECKAAGVKVEFEKIKSGFLVTFYRSIISPLQGRNGKSEGVNEGVSEGITSLLAYIRQIPGQRVPRISQALKLAPKTLERWLKKLKAEGKIKYEGSAKIGGYYIT